MDFEFFESLTQDQALDVLDAYMADGKTGLRQVRREASAQGISIELTLSGTIEFFQWVAPRLVTVRRGPDETVPIWIRSTPEYEAGLYDFEAASASLLLVWSYHLGQTFTRVYPDRLRWTTGRQGTAEVNQPVISGFNHKMEMSTMLVAENLFRRTLQEVEPTDFVTPAVDKWASLVC